MVLPVWQILGHVSFPIILVHGVMEGRTGGSGSTVLGFESRFSLKIRFSENCRSSLVAFSSVFSC